MKKKLIRKTTESFRQQFQSEPEFIFLSPGRINIIGEHVDYNHGFVMPAAINKYICFAVSPTNYSRCSLYASDLDDSFQFDLKEDIKPVSKTWANYILGVASQLKEAGHPIKGVNMVFSSTIPMGAGLSSSAALECGYAQAMNHLFQLGISRKDIALIGQLSEHRFVGVNCGIMDQFACVFGKKNKVIRLDCDTLEYDYHSIDFKEYGLLLFDSKVKHTHLTSGYNDRRKEVDQGLAMIKKAFPEVNTFRDCTEEMVDSLKSELGQTIYRRCHFVVKEIRRVMQAVRAIEKKDAKALGKLMTETHAGLSKEYEVSCPELDYLVEEALSYSGVIGARMMGGGFGGCTLNLVRNGTEKKMIKHIAQAYQQQFGISLASYQVKITDGAGVYQK